MIKWGGVVTDYESKLRVLYYDRLVRVLSLSRVNRGEISDAGCKGMNRIIYGICSTLLDLGADKAELDKMIKSWRE